MGPGPQGGTVPSTAWMGGTFASQLTRGHACAQPMLSVRRGCLGVRQAEGLRMFVREQAGTWHLLATPSAWVVDGSNVTWFYQWEAPTREPRRAVANQRVPAGPRVRAHDPARPRGYGGGVDGAPDPLRESHVDIVYWRRLLAAARAGRVPGRHR